MIKATDKRKLTVKNTADLSIVADYLTQSQDTARIALVERRAVLAENIRGNEDRIERALNDIENWRVEIMEYTNERDQIEREIADLPVPRPVSPEKANTDLVRVLALPYIKSIGTEEMDGKQYIVIETRANSLYTTLDRKYSRAERWYKSKPYRIPLPVYNIRIGIVPSKTLAGNSEALGLSFADHAADTAHWLEWVNRYRQEPHPHWGTQSASSSNYKAVCLGEYESEVSQAFKKSIADGIASFAVYLQTAGTTNAYVQGRHLWALWLGKKEYNTAIIPSEKEIKTLEQDDDDCSCYENDGEDRVCDDDCECDCHD